MPYAHVCVINSSHNYVDLSNCATANPALFEGRSVLPSDLSLDYPSHAVATLSGRLMTAKSSGVEQSVALDTFLSEVREMNRVKGQCYSSTLLHR